MSVLSRGPVDIAPNLLYPRVFRAGVDLDLIDQSRRTTVLAE